MVTADDIHAAMAAALQWRDDRDALAAHVAALEASGASAGPEAEPIDEWTIAAWLVAAAASAAGAAKMPALDAPHPDPLMLGAPMLNDADRATCWAAWQTSPEACADAFVAIVGAFNPYTSGQEGGFRADFAALVSGGGRAGRFAPRVVHGTNTRWKGGQAAGSSDTRTGAFTPRAVAARDAFVSGEAPLDRDIYRTRAGDDGEWEWHLLLPGSTPPANSHLVRLAVM